MTLTVDDRELIERLRKDADRQDGEEETIVSTNCMRNAADRLQSLLSEQEERELKLLRDIEALVVQRHALRVALRELIVSPSPDAFRNARAALIQTEVP